MITKSRCWSETLLTDCHQRYEADAFSENGPCAAFYTLGKRKLLLTTGKLQEMFQRFLESVE